MVYLMTLVFLTICPYGDLFGMNFTKKLESNIGSISSQAKVPYLKRTALGIDVKINNTMISDSIARKLSDISRGYRSQESTIFKGIESPEDAHLIVNGYIDSLCDKEKLGCNFKENLNILMNNKEPLALEKLSLFNEDDYYSNQERMLPLKINPSIDPKLHQSTSEIFKLFIHQLPSDTPINNIASITKLPIENNFERCKVEYSNNSFFGREHAHIHLQDFSFQAEELSRYTIITEPLVSVPHAIAHVAMNRNQINKLVGATKKGIVVDGLVEGIDYSIDLVPPFLKEHVSSFVKKKFAYPSIETRNKIQEGLDLRQAVYFYGSPIDLNIKKEMIKQQLTDVFDDIIVQVEQATLSEIAKMDKAVITRLSQDDFETLFKTTAEAYIEKSLDPTRSQKILGSQYSSDGKSISNVAFFLNLLHLRKAIFNTK